jgi:hypothetical protein
MWYAELSLSETGSWIDWRTDPLLKRSGDPALILDFSDDWSSN